MADVQHANIVPDDDEGISDVNDKESTASIRSSILEYPVENGRRYHAFKSGTYPMPNDEPEMDRLDIVNAFMVIMNDGKLHRAPLEKTKALRMLDIGAGTGIWAIEMGDEYPAAEIVGIDISANMPGMVPPNVKFEVADVEDEWTFGAPFDYIHSRYMVGAVQDWEGMIRKCFDNIKPGGWVELQDFDIQYYSQDNTLTPNHGMYKWVEYAHEATPMTHRTLRPGPQLEKWVKDAGFTNVQVVKHACPVGPWPKDKNLKMIGYLNWTQLMDGLEGLSLRLFCGVLGWSQEQFQALMAEVRNDLNNPKLHALHDAYSVWGQKPM